MGTHRLGVYEEKPTVERARALVETQRYGVNAGMFALTPSALKRAIAIAAPDLDEPDGGACPSIDDALFAKLGATSIDARAALADARFRDLGTLRTLDAVADSNAPPRWAGRDVLIEGDGSELSAFGYDGTLVVAASDVSLRRAQSLGARWLRRGAPGTRLHAVVLAGGVAADVSLANDSGADVQVRVSRIQAARDDRLVICTSGVEAASRFALRLVLDRLGRAIEGRGGAVMLASAGRSPKRLYALLASEGREQIPWHRVRVMTMDELPTTERSGPFEAQIRRELAAPLGIRHVVAPRDVEGVRALEASLRLTPPDLAIHGIGENGHLAFCEPGRGLERAGGRVCLADVTRTGLARALGSPAPREALTLGLPTLRRARSTLLLAFGSSKRAALRDTLSSAAPEPGLPASVLCTQPDVTVACDFHALGVRQ